MHALSVSAQNAGVQCEDTCNHIHGLDMSHYQGEVFWETLGNNSHQSYVYFKATEGKLTIDATYKKNMDYARKYGLKVGSYHYYHAHIDQEVQLRHFMSQCRPGDQDLIPMIDVEEKGNRGCNREKLQATLKELMELMKAEYGKYPLLYSGHRFYNTYLAPEFNNYYLFIARYGGDKPKVKGDGRWNIWQYSETGHIDGIKGKVDLDCFAPGTSLRDISF